MIFCNYLTLKNTIIQMIIFGKVHPIPISSQSVTDGNRYVPKIAVCVLVSWNSHIADDVHIPLRPNSSYKILNIMKIQFER